MAVSLRSCPVAICLFFLPFIFTATIVVATTHLHHPPGVVSGHYLQDLGTRALQFEVEHRRPLLFWDELAEDGVQLQTVAQASSSSLFAGSSPMSSSDKNGTLALRLSGRRLDPSDFAIRGSVLVIRRRVLQHAYGTHRLSVGRVSRRGSAVYLSVTRAVVDKNELTTNAITVYTQALTRADAHTAVTQIRFRHCTARVHPRAGAGVRRRFHVYDRHSIRLDAGARQIGSPNPFGLNPEDPITACLVSKQAPELGLTPEILEIFGFKPVTICELELIGELLSEKLSTAPLSATTPAALYIRSVTPGLPASAGLNVTLYANGYGTFNVTSDQVNFTLDYYGVVTAEYNCPGGCFMRLASGEWRVPNYHQKMKTSEGAPAVPEIEGFRLTSDITVRWAAKFGARANVTLALAQRFNSSTSVVPGRDPLIVTAPTPENTNLVMGRLGGTEDGEARGPWGFFEADTTVRTRFRNTGTVIANRMDFTAGFRVRTFGNDANPRYPKRLGAIGGSVCSRCHSRRVSLAPFLGNASTIVETTDPDLGWTDIDTAVTNPPAGSALTYCAIPTACPTGA